MAATRQAIDDRLNHEQRTALALPTLTTPWVIPTAAPIVQTSEVGILTACEDAGYSKLLHYRNCWADTVNGVYITVVAGAEIDLPNKSEIGIYTWKATDHTETSDIYTPASQHGALTIVSVAFPQITFVAADGTNMTFNLMTRTWRTLTGEPALQLTGTIATGTLTVTVPGRFSLVFDAAHTWQATHWYDLGTSATTNLARADGTTFYNVVQSPMELGYDQWYNLADATNPTMAIAAQDSSHVVLDTGWTWTANDGSTFVVTATHTISTVGIWQVDTNVTNTSVDTRTISNGIAYAFTNVDPSLGWQETLGAYQRTFTHTRTTGATPYPQLKVTRHAPHPACPCNRRRSGA